MSGLDRRNMKDELNRMAPAAAHVKLGDVVDEIIAKYNALLSDVTAFQAALNTNVVIPATLAIKAAGSAVVKTTSEFVGVANGVAHSKAANTDMPALVGTVAAGKSALWAFYMDGTGALTAGAKSADAASHGAALALLPAVPSGLVSLGFIVVDNGSASGFVGGTTALDATNITVTYFNTSSTTTFSSALTAVAVLDLEHR
jgi:hypothetical protein